MDDTTTQAMDLPASLTDRPRLVVARSPVAALMGQPIPLGDAPLVVGRAVDANLRLNDAGTSRRHARISPVEGGFEVMDLGSTNGTFVNGHRVARARLHEGDRIQVGSLTVLRFTAEPDRDSENLGRALASAGIGLYEWSVEQGQLVGSDNLEQMLRVPLSRLSGSPRALLRHVAPASRSSAEAAFTLLVARGEPVELVVEVLAEGSPRFLSIKAELLRDQDGSPMFVVGTVLDLTQQRRSEEELRRQAQVFESLYDAVVVSDLRGQIAQWSERASQTFRRAGAEVLGRPLASLGASTGAQQATEAMIESVQRSGRWTGEVSLTDGRMFEAVTVALRDPEGTAVAHLTAFRDVTERKRMEAGYLLADRLASVGTLAAGVAHEINNPLAFIRANLAYMREELEAARGLKDEVAADLFHVLDETQEGARRIEIIVRDLKNFSRADERAEVEAVNLRAMLQFVLKMVENQVRHRAQLEFDVAPELFVRGTEARLGQVFVNLLVNAAQAIPDGDARHHAIRVRAHARPGAAVAVEVEDTGPGMSPEVRARLFSPFFTTKRVGEGTGLGLSVSHAIVTGFGGEIEVDTQPGRGTTFRVILRSAPDPAVKPLTPKMVRSAPSGAARVLVVDDDRLVANALKRMLSSAHQVTTVGSGAEALELLKQKAFDVVLCDLMMPDVSGMELHAQLTRTRPDLLPRLAFVTGGAFTERAKQFVEEVQRPVLRKPFDSATILELVRTTLETQGRAADPVRPNLRIA